MVFKSVLSQNPSLFDLLETVKYFPISPNPDCSVLIFALKLAFVEHKIS